MEGCLFLRRLAQIDRTGLIFAELVEDRAQITDLICHLVGAAEFDFIAVVIPHDDIIFLFHIDGADMLEKARAVKLAHHAQNGAQRRG